MAINVPGAKRPIKNTLLTDATRVHADWYKPLPAEPGPQWELWLNLPAVELWEAIAISCGLEPKRRPMYLCEADPKFRLRMEVAIRNGLGKGNRPHIALVKLATVAQLAQKCAWTLPPEFPRPEPEPAQHQAEPAEAPRSTQTTLDMGVPKGEILAVFTNPIRGKPKGSGRRCLVTYRAGWMRPGLTRAGEAFNPAGTPPSSPCALRKRGTWGAGRLDLLSGVTSRNISRSGKPTPVASNAGSFDRLTGTLYRQTYRHSPLKPAPILGFATGGRASKNCR